MSLIQDLQNIGLSDKEAKVYLANLELGQSSVQQISKKSGVKRATVYVILESLIQKGLVSTYHENKKIFYVAAHPDVLGGNFELQKKEIEEKQKYFEKLLPQLRSIDSAQSGKPTVQFFEGKSGIMSSIREHFVAYSNKNEVVRMIYPYDRVKEILTPEEKKELREYRIGKGIKSRVIITASEKVESTPDGDRVAIPEKEFPITCDIEIYQDNVNITSLGEKLSAVLIQDKEIANTLKSIFELAWEAAQARAKKKK